MYFRYFIIIFPWKRTESQSLKDALCQVWFKLAHWFWRSRSKISLMYFCYFEIISPWKRAWPLIWKNLNPLNPRMLCANYVWLKLASWFLRIWFLTFFDVFLLFRNYLPLEKSWVLHLKKNLTQGCFVISLFEIGPVILQKKILKFREGIFAIS